MSLTELLAEYGIDLPVADETSGQTMMDMMEELFPIYRALCGPGFKQSLEMLRKWVDLSIAEYPTGSEVLGWTIPPEFSVREAWVENVATGERVIAYARHPYSGWLYSQPFDGVVDREELLRHTASLPYLRDVIPLRMTYYRKEWGVSAPQAVVDALPPGQYRVHIDTVHAAGSLRIGEAYLPGDSDEEVLINSYLCHPLGANDNLSGVVVAVELFRLLSRLPRRRFSYRLALWPESIGAITYIHAHPDRMGKMVGGLSLNICGDGKPIRITESFSGETLFDRAARHALKVCGHPVDSRPFSNFDGGSSDTGHFNSVGLRKALCGFTRGGPTPEGYIQYHTAADDLSVVSAKHLLETLEVAWTTLMVAERATKPKATYAVTPFLSKYGVFPYKHGAGMGTHGNDIAKAYFELMVMADGDSDLLAIAERTQLPIFAYDEPVAEFTRVGLLHP